MFPKINPPNPSPNDEDGEATDPTVSVAEDVKPDEEDDDDIIARTKSARDLVYVV